MSHIHYSQITPNIRISFEVYPTSILGNNFKDVLVEAVVNAQAALTFGTDIHSLHAKVFPTLPQGSVPDNPTSYPYVGIRHQNGEKQFIGIPWIRPETLTLSRGGRVTMVFEDLTQTEIDRINLSLQAINQRPDHMITDEP